MRFNRIDHAGFAPHRGGPPHRRRSIAVAQLVASMALALSITVAATAVTIGIARADGVVAIAQDSSAHVAAGTVLAMIVIAVGLAVAVKRNSARIKTDE